MRASFLLHAIWMLFAGSVAALRVARGRWRVAVTNRRCSANVCREVIGSQPNVLVLPRGWKHNISKWNGRIVNIRASNFTPVLPFVGRRDAVARVVDTLMFDLETAKEIEKCSSCIRSLWLVGSSAPHGSGQTTLGRVIHKSLQKAIGEAQEVVYCRITAKSIFRIWTDDICSQPGMKGLRNAIRKDMIFDEFVHETERFLAAENRILFLHFDDLVPFRNNGEHMQDSLEKFVEFWWETFHGLMCTPRVCLYFSGAMPYGDNIYGSGYTPFRFEPIELSPLELTDIHTALTKMFVADPAHAEQIRRLSEVLDAKLSFTGISGSWDLAQRLHALTAGIPLYVEHALHALLTSSAFSADLWQDHQPAGLASRLSSTLDRNGAVYNAVQFAAEDHFSAQFTAAHDGPLGGTEMDQREHLAHLLDLVLLQGKTLQLCQKDADKLRGAWAGFMACKGVMKLLHEAHAWGVHRTFHNQDATVTFHLPPAVREGLAGALGGDPDMQRILQQLRRDVSVANGISIRAVETALVLHHRVARAAAHPNWLGLVKPHASSSASVKAATPPRSLRAQKILPPVPWKLPRLPRIHARGKLLSEEKIAAIVNGDSADAQPQSCRPGRAGRFLLWLPRDNLHALAAQPESDCADFVVHFNDHVTHLYVIESGRVTAQTLLTACVDALPMVRETSKYMNHTIAFIVSDPAARDAAVREFAKRPPGVFAAKVVVAAKVRAEEVEANEAVAASAPPATPVPAAAQSSKGGRGGAKEGRDLAATARRRKARNIAAMANLLRKGELNVAVLDDAQLDRFLQYNALVEDLLGDAVGSV